MSSDAELFARLTGPGAPFEIVVEDVLGERMPVISSRARSLRELLLRSKAHGEKEYIVHGARRIRYDEHLDLVASVAHALRDRYGVRRGDRVAILAENCPEWLIAFWATISLGGVVAALNGWWQADEILHGVADSEPALLIADRKRLARLEGRDPGVPVLEIESQFAALEGYRRGAGLPAVEIAEDDPAVILYTSGTTGRAKGAVNTHRGICGFVTIGQLQGVKNMLRAVERGVKPSPAPPLCSLLTVPLFHLSGLYAGAVSMLAAGGKTVWRSGRFDPGDVLRLIEAERVTHWSALGNMAHRVVSHPDVSRYDLSSIQGVGSGGGPTSPEIQERLRKVFPRGGANMGIGYGLSESVTAVAMIGGEELQRFPTSVGRPMPTHEIEIRDPKGRVVPEGSEGEIFIRSPYLMLGYWRRPDATAEALLPGRWLRTGDIGRFEDGRLYINSRARDMILRGGENIHPVEIEHRLEAHPRIAEAAVFGVDHRELFQEVKAVVVLEPGPAPDPASLAAWVGEALAPFKVPAHWELRREPLPRNAAGKVMKHVLRGDAQNAFTEE
ncbi:MAG TPA: class I adenylate-forming enzyme family protein [Myxococcota bacterium]|nr:class I adenylate-forming enzyme family protein [Myxococcota bacterium]